MTLTAKLAAARFGVSPSLVYALCAAGTIAHTRHGLPGRGDIRISEEEELERYKAACAKDGSQDTKRGLSCPTP